MREILFRGKRIDNGEWIYGFAYEHEPPLQAVVTKDYKPEKSKWYIVKTAFADWNMPRQVQLVEVDPETVGQFTGLTDKNGKKIFEGDFIKAGKAFGVVKMGEYCPQLLNNFSDFIGYSIPKSLTGVYVEICESKEQCFICQNGLIAEVAGNIQDNPELLEAAHEKA